MAGVSGAVNGIAAPSYQYDANGNLKTGAGRTVSWTAANMVNTVGAGTVQLAFHYSPERERYEEIYSRNGAVQRTTVYAAAAAGGGLFFEEETGPAGTKLKHYVRAGGATVAMIQCTATPCTTVANTTTQYWHEDHLGSVSAVTNQARAVLERMAYEPFGKRRNSNGTTDPNGTLVPVTTDRGFTEHEHMDEVGLVNMNGRIYDAALGRFLSADPTIPDAENPQAYNRYSYTYNNPMVLVDPSGFDPFSAGGSATWDGSSWSFAFSASNTGGYFGAYYPFATWSLSNGFVFTSTMAAGNGRWYSTTSGNLEGASTGIPSLDSVVSSYTNSGRYAANYFANLGSAETEERRHGGVIMSYLEQLDQRFGEDLKRLAILSPERAAESADYWRSLKVRSGNPAYGALEAVAQTWAEHSQEVLMVLSTGRAAGRQIAAKGGQVFRNLAPADEIVPAVLFPASQIQKVGYSGRLTYVVTQSGELVIGRTGHITLSRGADVLAAGEARFVKGSLRTIDNASGHYRPSGASAQNAAEAAFRGAGFDGFKYVERTFP